MVPSGYYRAGFRRLSFLQFLFVKHQGDELMAWTQNASPNTSTQDNPGWCLRFVQSVYGSPVAYPSATAAWNATGQKYYGRDMPSVSVPVWFSWVGDIDGTGAKDWGHVVAWIPERGQFLSSPLYWSQGYGQSWVNSIEEIEQILGCTYVGFSADLNGLQIATYTEDPAPTPTPTPTPSGTTCTVGVFPDWNGSLWGIADHFYGDGSRWNEIYEANVATIGDNPGLIFPGQVLTIPGV